MSTVAALIEPSGRIVHGCESRSSSAASVEHGATKWARFGPWALGHVGFACYLDALQLEGERLAAVEWDPNAGDLDQAARLFALELRRVLEGAGYERTKDSEQPAFFPSVGWLLSAPGRLWDLQATGCLTAIVPYSVPLFRAIGSGGMAARGAAEALERVGGFSAVEVMHRAIDAATLVDPNSGGAIHVFETTPTASARPAR